MSRPDHLYIGPPTDEEFPPEFIVGDLDLPTWDDFTTARDRFFAGLKAHGDLDDDDRPRVSRFGTP
jgi:hypothetical protein